MPVGGRAFASHAPTGRDVSDCTPGTAAITAVRSAPERPTTSNDVVADATAGEDLVDVSAGIRAADEDYATTCIDRSSDELLQEVWAHGLDCL